VESIAQWLTHPRFSSILADLVAEMARNPELSDVVEDMIGRPRRERGRAILVRAIDRGEVSPDIDMELALDLLAAPIYWRLLVRDGSLEPGYLDGLTEMLLRALSA
jgi:hypothetical protein